MKIDYSTIKRCIIKSCKQESSKTLNFKIDSNKLNDLVKKECNLSFIDNGTISRPVKSFDIPLISEYFKKEKLEWFNRSKHYTSITFIDEESLDDEAKRLLVMLHDSNRIANPEFDSVEAVAYLLANYPCYSAVVVAYQSGDPNRIGKNSYTIIIRANVNAITKEGYEYNNEDI